MTPPEACASSQSAITRGDACLPPSSRTPPGLPREDAREGAVLRCPPAGASTREAPWQQTPPGWSAGGGSVAPTQPHHHQVSWSGSAPRAPASSTVAWLAGSLRRPRDMSARLPLYQTLYRKAEPRDPAVQDSSRTVPSIGFSPTGHSGPPRSWRPRTSRWPTSFCHTWRCHRLRQQSPSPPLERRAQGACS